MREVSNILFFNPNPYKSGGSNISILEVIGGLDRSRFKPFMAIPRNNEYKDKLDELGVEIIDYDTNLGWFPTERHLHRHLASLQDRVSYLVAQIDSKEIALVCTNCDNVFEAPLACITAGIPHVWRQTGSFDGQIAIFKHFPLTPSAQAFLLAEVSEKIVCVSPSQQAVFETFFNKDKISLIEPLGLPPAKKLTKTQAKYFLKENYGIDPSTKLILTVGRVSPEKDLLTFCRTAKELSKRDTSNKLLFIHVGNKQHPEYLSEIQNFIITEKLDEKVLFLGEKNREEVNNFYYGADVFLFTSKTEGFATACAEAMQTGLPVVSTRCSGPIDYIQHEETGFLCEIGDFESLANCTQTLLKNESIANQIGGAGQTSINEKYDPPIFFEKWNNLFSSLIESKSKRNNYRSLQYQFILNILTQIGKTETRLDTIENRLERVETIRSLLLDNRFMSAMKSSLAFVRKTVGQR